MSEAEWCKEAKFIGYSLSDLPVYECSLLEMRVTPLSELCKECDYRKKSKRPQKKNL